MIKKIIFCLVFSLVFVQSVYADGSPSISRYTLNGIEADVTINPTSKKETVLSIGIETDRAVKITRIYICPVSGDADCKDYIKYLSISGDPNTTFTKDWNAYITSDASPATPGSYWLRVLLKEGESDSVPVSLTAYKIIIGELKESTGEDDDGDDDTATTTTAQTIQTTSSHSSQASLTQAEEEAVSIGAGRARLATVGMPVKFKAVVKNRPSNLGFVWSFGDGSEARGEEASHAYKFPGEYQVVLNASYSGGNEAVSRTSVRVFSPDIIISEANAMEGYLELANGSDRETNIQDWKIVCDNGGYTFVRDTIIGAKAKLKIPLELVGCQRGVVKLISPDIKFASVRELSGAVSYLASTTDPVQLKKQIVALAVQMERMKQAANGLGKISANSVDGIPVVVGRPTADEALAEDSLDQTAQVIMLGPDTGKGSWWSKVRSRLGR